MKKRMLAAMIFVLILTMASACSKSIEQQVAEQLELGQKYLAELNYEEAIVAFQKIIELDPKNVNAYIELDSAYTAMSDYEKAAQVLEQGYTATESDDIKNLWTDRQYDLGQAYLGMQDFDSATAAFDKAVELDSGNADLFIKIAEACINLGNSELAASYLEHGMKEIGPDNVSTEYKNLLVDTYLTLAKACEEAGNDEAAEQYYDHILELIPDHEEAVAQKEHLLQKRELEKYYEDIVNTAKQLIGDNASDISSSLLFSDEFKELVEGLEQPVIYETDSGDYMGVYPGGYIYYGEMKDGKREGNGNWFWVTQNSEDGHKSYRIFSGMWHNDYPNGEGKLVNESLNRVSNYDMKGVKTGNCVDGYFDGPFVLMTTGQDGKTRTFDMILHGGKPEVIADNRDSENPYVFSYSRENSRTRYVGDDNTRWYVSGAIKE